MYINIFLLLIILNTNFILLNGNMMSSLNLWIAVTYCFHIRILFINKLYKSSEICNIFNEGFLIELVIYVAAFSVIINNLIIFLPQDLVEDIKSELGGNFEDLCVALLTPQIIFLADCLYEAVKVSMWVESWDYREMDHCFHVL